MITWQVDELIKRYEEESGETLTYRQIADGSGISKSTVWKVLSGQSQSADFAVASKLLVFFSDRLGRELELTDILKYERATEGTTS